MWAVHISQSIDISGTLCLPCSAGTYLGGENGNCVPCPVGSFQSLDGQTRCEPCGRSKTTTNPGSDSPEECVCKYSLRKIQFDGPFAMLSVHEHVIFYL